MPARLGRDVQLVFADIDGTLVNSEGTLSDRTRRAVAALQQSGRCVVICTGRSRDGAQRVAKLLGSSGPGIVLNGAVVVDWHRGTILRSALLPKDRVRQACRIARRVGLACVWLGTEEAGDRQYVRAGERLWHRYEARNSQRLERVADLADLPELPASLAAYGTQQEAEALAEAWKRELEGDVVAVAGPTAAYGAWYAQLTAASGTKVAAAEFIAASLGIDRSRTAAVGDHLNDVELLTWAGVGICMGDGHPTAVSAADYVTASLEEDGAALALERMAPPG